MRESRGRGRGKERERHRRPVIVREVEKCAVVEWADVMRGGDRVSGERWPRSATHVSRCRIRSPFRACPSAPTSPCLPTVCRSFCWCAEQVNLSTKTPQKHHNCHLQDTTQVYPRRSTAVSKIVTIPQISLEAPKNGRKQSRSGGNRLYQPPISFDCD